MKKNLVLNDEEKLGEVMNQLVEEQDSRTLTKATVFFEKAGFSDALTIIQYIAEKQQDNNEIKNEILFGGEEKNEKQTDSSSTNNDTEQQTTLLQQFSHLLQLEYFAFQIWEASPLQKFAESIPLTRDSWFDTTSTVKHSLEVFSAIGSVILPLLAKFVVAPPHWYEDPERSKKITTRLIDEENFDLTKVCLQRFKMMIKDIKLDVTNEITALTSCSNAVKLLKEVLCCREQEKEEEKKSSSDKKEQETTTNKDDVDDEMIKNQRSVVLKKLGYIEPMYQEIVINFFDKVNPEWKSHHAVSPNFLRAILPEKVFEQKRIWKERRDRTLLAAEEEKNKQIEINKNDPWSCAQPTSSTTSTTTTTTAYNNIYGNRFANSSSTSSSTPFSWGNNINNNSKNNIMSSFRGGNDQTATNNTTTSNETKSSETSSSNNNKFVWGGGSSK